ncbi:hypothetical protein SADUNF_Sadunf18G0107900 [Salix dunnii]|uniref:Calcineurin-like phosphoesterase domain-containing protein n=1 Tax=Salix dunnii TaxID=1413687 RepID=A0A835J730_9ROSI|nr:hypothetical protein SADUNF_Sadunf18G0107900 [Salix dunnii]
MRSLFSLLLLIFLINSSVEDASSAARVVVITGIDGLGNYNLAVYGAPGSHLANSSALDLFLLWRQGGCFKELEQDSLLSAPCALAFFHIPIPEVRRLYYQKITGQFQEVVACSAVNSGVLQTLVSMGDVKAVFMGHDHKNDFCGNVEGIWLCYGGGFGYHAGGRSDWVGENSWMGIERLRTWKRVDDEIEAKQA